MGFKGGVVLGTVSFNATGSGTTAIGATSNTGTIAIGNTSSAAVSIDCGTAGITVGTTANAHSSTFGSTNSTSATTIQSGSGTLSITATNGAITANSGTGTISVSSDATNTTVNLATGAGAKVTTLGSTNGASSLALKYGTADMTLASATGTVISALDTGEITYPLQPAFSAYNSSTDSNVTGDGTAYVIICDTEIYDQNADYNNGTGVFTAPVTGRYYFYGVCQVSGLAAAHTSGFLTFVSSNRTYTSCFLNWGAVRVTSSFAGSMGGYVDMDAADTIDFEITVSNSTKVVNVIGAASMATYFGGELVA